MEIFSQITATPMVLLIPVIAGLVGWGTNALAVLMMFRPKDFVGIQPYLGWQGIIPRFTPKAAAFTADLVADHLLNLKELFAEFDPRAFLRESEDVIDGLIHEKLDEEVNKFAPQVWANLDETAKEQVRKLAKEELQSVSIRVLKDLGDNIDRILDLRFIVRDSLAKEKMLLARIMLRVAGPEINFIRLSGLYFGFLFGIVQMVVWLLWPTWWLLPLAGFFVGYITNYLALYLIFDPKHPKQVGPFKLQGMMHKRQADMSEGVAKEIAAIVLDPNVLTMYMTTGERGEVLFGILRKNLDEVIDKYKNHSMASVVMQHTNAESLKGQLFSRIEDEVRRPGGFLEHFIRQSVDVFGEITDKMTGMDPETFEGLLRPVFQEEEWILIAVGAVLGLLAGWAQVAWLFGDALL